MLRDLHEVLEALEPIAEAAVYGSPALSKSKLVPEELATGYFLQRRKLASADLGWLEVPERPVRTELSALAAQMTKAPLASRMGLAYVLMGQSLGAAMLHRSLMTNAGLLSALGVGHSSPQDAKPPLSFFAGHGKSSAQYWSIFLGVLELSVPAQDTNACRYALEGAIRGFEGFRIVWPPPHRDPVLQQESQPTL